jgi:hypothetical protein
VITLLTNILPIIFGFLGKLLALKSQANSDMMKLSIVRSDQNMKAIAQAVEQSNKESPQAAWNRRFIIVVILGLIIFTQVAPVVFDVPTVIKTIKEGYSLFGFIELTPDVVEYITVDGMLKFDEIFAWSTMIVEFYFGAQLAKGK